MSMQVTHPPGPAVAEPLPQIVPMRMRPSHANADLVEPGVDGALLHKLGQFGGGHMSDSIVRCRMVGNETAALRGIAVLLDKKSTTGTMP